MPPAPDPFDVIAPTYDALRFLRVTAERLVAVVALPPGARVLDVATGTGAVALAAARAVGAGGEVIGIDPSAGMLEVARRKAATLAGGAALRFERCGPEGLPSAGAPFDAVLCASALFVLPEPAAALRSWARLLRPGGRVAFSTFGPTFLEPLRGLWAATLARHGLTGGAPPTHRLNGAEGCRALLRQAGLDEVALWEEQLGYALPDVDGRWAEIATGMEGLPLRALDPDRRAAIEAEHRAELAPLVGERGLWVDVPVLFALGRRPT